MSTPAQNAAAPLPQPTKRQLWRAITTLCRTELRKGTEVPRVAWRSLVNAADAMAAAAVVAAASSASGEQLADRSSVRRKRERACHNSGCKPSSRCSDCVTAGVTDLDFASGGRASRWRERSAVASAFSGRFRQDGDALRHFRLVARIVIVCAKWVSPLTRQRDKQIRSFVDVAKELEGSMRQRQLETAGSVFNRTDYSPEKELTISKDVERVLQLRREERSDDMIAQMVISLRTLQAFAEYPIHIQEQLCRVAEYQMVPPGRVIVRAGNRGECFYIVISGRGQTKSVVRNTGTGEVNVDSVGTLRRGQKFGDEALLRRTERTVTVESVTTMRLLAIEKSDFAEIFMKENAYNKEPEYMSFLRKVNFLKFFPLDRLKSCGDHCVFQYFSSGKVVVADSLTSDYIYIVKSGSCAVLKQLKAELGAEAIATPSLLARRGAEQVPSSRRAAAPRGATRKRRPARGMLAHTTDEDTDCSSDSSSRRRQSRDVVTTTAAAAADAGWPSVVAGPCQRENMTGLRPEDGLRRRPPAAGGGERRGGGGGEEEKGTENVSANERPEVHPYTPSIAVPRNECPPLLADAEWLPPPSSSTYDSMSDSGADRKSDAALADVKSRARRRRWQKSSRRSHPRHDAVAAEEIVASSTNGNACTDYMRLDLFRRHCPAAVAANAATADTPAHDRRTIPTRPGIAPSHGTDVIKDRDAADSRVVIRPLTDATPRRRSGRCLESNRQEQPLRRAYTEMLPIAAVTASLVGAAKGNLLIPHRDNSLASATAAAHGCMAGARNDSDGCPPLPSLAEADGRREDHVRLKVGCSDRPPLPSQPHSTQRSAYVQLAVLKPTDAFGLDTLAFDPHFRRSRVSVSLVSNGAELILLSKKYFLQHCDERTLGHLRANVAPSPTERQLQLALTRLLDWDVYKKTEMGRLTAGASPPSSVALSSRGSDQTAATARTGYSHKLVSALLQRYTF